MPKSWGTEMSEGEWTSDDGSTVISEDRALAVDEAGRRAGAALRSPAPAHGAAAIQGRAHRRRVARVAAATAGVGVLLVSGVMALKSGDGSVEQQPLDTLTNTLPHTNSTTPNSTAAPSTIGTTSTVTAVETAGTPGKFTEPATGEMVELPDWPLSERRQPPMVWTGTELIAWGGGIYDAAADGAAFDLASGTWRVIAEAPLVRRSEPAVVWTGTEMIVWGGRVDDTFYYDGAAYDPATNTWRLLASAPRGFNDPHMVWTGHEAVVLADGAAAYDPTTDSWRTLATPPVQPLYQRPVWTGDSIVVTNAGYGQTFGSDNAMARYDLAADRWTVVEVGSSTAVVGVPGSDGRVNTFIDLSSETGAPVRLIDSAGTQIAELPAFPADPEVFGDVLSAFGLWVGDEAVFEISSPGDDYAGEQIWALNPSTQAWHRLDMDIAFPRVDSSAVVAGDLLVMWNRGRDKYQGPPGAERSCCAAPLSNGGSVYRVGS